MNVHSTAKLIALLAMGQVCSVSAEQLPAKRPAVPQTNDKATPSALDPKKYEIQPGDSELKKLMKQRLQAAINDSELQFAEFRVSRGSLTDGLDEARRILEARLALVENRAEELEVRRNYWNSIREGERLTQARFDAGAIKEQDLQRAKYWRIDAEIQVLRAGGTLTEAEKLPPPVPVPPRPNEDGTEPNKLPAFVAVVPYVIDAAEPELKRLLKQRANYGMAELRLRYDTYLQGRGYDFDLLDCARRVRDSRLQLAGDQTNRQEVLTHYYDVTLAVAEKAARICAPTPGTYEKYRYPCFDAKVDVLRASATGRELGKIPTLEQSSDVPPKVDEFDGDPDGIPDIFKASVFVIDEALPELERLPKERANRAVQAARHCFQSFRVGRGTMDELFNSIRHARDSRLELVNDPLQRTEIMKQGVEILQRVEKMNQARFEAGAIKQQYVELSRYERLGAEIDLLRAKK